MDARLAGQGRGFKKMHCRFLFFFANVVKWHLEKLAFGNFFECADEFYRRYNSATKNIAFSKLPIKTEVFIGSLKKNSCVLRKSCYN